MSPAILSTYSLQLVVGERASGRTLVIFWECSNKVVIVTCVAEIRARAAAGVLSEENCSMWGLRGEQSESQCYDPFWQKLVDGHWAEHWQCAAMQLHANRKIILQSLPNMQFKRKPHGRMAAGQSAAWYPYRSASIHYSYVNSTCNAEHPEGGREGGVGEKRRG